MPSLDALDPSAWPEPALAATSLVWRRRVVNEVRSVELAVELVRAYERCSLCAVPIAAALALLAEDERRHVELASAFLARIGASAPESHDVAGDDGGARDDDDVSSLFLLRCVATGLVVCETVSAARFAVVRTHTDLAVPRACIELFLRDELAHARLGFVLLPGVLAHRARVVGAAQAASDLAAELGATFRHLDVVVGLDAERRGIRLEARPQPPCNAGVVEPALDAIAFRDAITRTVVPRLARIGVDAGAIWSERWAAPHSA
jgi:hypothetical protein